MPRALRLIAVVPVLLALMWAVSIATSVVRADALAREAATEMATWTAARVTPAQGTWDSVRAKLIESIRLRPLDASTHELLGLLGIMRREDDAIVDQGVRHLVQALEARPVSPYTWGSLAEARYTRGASASAVEAALLQAAHLGPSEPAVQRLVVDYGLALWPELSAAGRAEVDRRLASGMRRNPLEMLRISERRGRLEAACRHVVGSEKPDPRIGRTCERWEITP
jgi:hypothetical protein